MSPLAAAPVTLRSAVNTWECDENGHMNVQFYAERFDHAAAQAALSGAPAGLPRLRHVRYHRELHAGESLLVRSLAVADGPCPATMVHGLYSLDREVLAATAVDGFAAAGGGTPAARFADLPEAAPRGLAEAPPAAAAGFDALIAAGAIETFRGIIPPRLCDAAGEARIRAFVHCFTDAAGHFWTAAGFHRQWFEARNLGRAVVEMRLAVERPLRADMAVANLTVVTRATAKVLAYRHHLFDLTDGRPAGSADIATVIFDLAQRRAVTLPEPLLARYGAAIEA